MPLDTLVDSKRWFEVNLSNINIALVILGVLAALYILGILQEHKMECQETKATLAEMLLSGYNIGTHRNATLQHYIDIR